MDEPTEIERLRINVEIANARASLALEMLSKLISDLHRTGATRETISDLAGIPYIQETEGSDPARAIAAMALRTRDPDVSIADRMRADRAEHDRHYKRLLEYVRRDHSAGS